MFIQVMLNGTLAIPAIARQVIVVHKHSIMIVRVVAVMFMTDITILVILILLAIV